MQSNYAVKFSGVVLTERRGKDKVMNRVIHTMTAT